MPGFMASGPCSSHWLGHSLATSLFWRLCGRLPNLAAGEMCACWRGCAETMTWDGSVIVLETQGQEQPHQWP